MAAYDRRIAEAAVSVLASRGSRGLTHRSVDRQAGLPAGTTSRYARTREALLNLVSRTLLEADWSVTAIRGDQDPANLLATITELLLAAPDRYRARVELQLESNRSATLAEHLQESRVGFCRALAERIGVSVEQADTLILVVDGVLHRQILLGEAPLSRVELTNLFEVMLGGRGSSERPQV